MLKQKSNKLVCLDIKNLLYLALPLIISGLLEQSLGFFNNIFLAHYDKVALSAGATASWILITFLTILWGTLSAINILVSRNSGSPNPEYIARIIRDGLIFAIIASIAAILLIQNLSPILLALNQNPQTVILTHDYLYSMSWAIFPDLAFTVFLNILIGLSQTKTNLFFTFLWITLNLFLNYTLVFGKFGLPMLGISAIGWGATLSFWLALIILCIYFFTNKNYKPYCLYIFNNNKSSVLKEIIKLGLPIGTMFCIELGFFTWLTLTMGTISVDTVAANQITLQYLSQVSLISLSFAQVSTVQISHKLSANNFSEADYINKLMLFITTFIMFLIAIIYWVYPIKLINLYFNNHSDTNQIVIKSATNFLAIGALFQIFENSRIVIFGALRAIKETRFCLLISIFSFWGIAIPLGYFINNIFKCHGEGFWWAMVFSQIISTFILFKYFKNKIKAYSNYM